MDCAEVGKFIQVYLDGEFEESDRRELEQHLKGCGGCQRQVDYQRRFKEAFRARMPRPTAPDAFRKRLLHALHQQPQHRMLPRVLAWSSVPAMAALVLILTFTWTVTSGFSPLVDEAVDRHSSSPPVEVNSDKDEEVENWFQAKVNFNVALPRFSARDFSLVGARLSHLAERQAALVRYRHGARNYSLFIFLDPGGSLGMQRCQKVAASEFCVSERRGYTVAVWRSRGLAYSLVGDLPPSQMLEALSSSFSK